MSKVKKIFVIIASVFMTLILAFIISICSIKSNVSIAVGEPYSVIIFDHAGTGKEIDGDDELKKFESEFKKLTGLTVYDKLVNGATLKNRIYQDKDKKFNTWSTDLQTDNLVVEIIYNSMQDLIVYEDSYTRVVSYYCISFVIPKTTGFTEIAVYYSLTSNNDGNEKNDSYASCTPLILYGNAETFCKYLENI